MLGVVWGLKEMAQHGVGPAAVSAVVAGLALGWVFVRRQQRLDDPLIDLKLFRIPEFSASLAVYTLGILVLFGSFLFIYQYLQLVLELSPIQAGLLTLPSFGAFVAGSMLAPLCVRRTGAATVLGGGLALAAVGLLGLTQLGAESGVGVLIASSIVYSLGIAPVFTLTNDVILGAAPPERAGAASAISETGAELGGALSIAVLGTIGTAVYRSQVADGIPAGVPEAEADAARDTLGGAVAAGESLPDSIAGPVMEAARVAFTDGLRVVALVSAAIAALAALGAWIFLRRARAGSGPGAEAGAGGVGPSADLEHAA